jgi:hypothetical protein
MVNINLVSMKEHDSESASCPTSDLKQFCEFSRIAEWMDTSGETQSSSHSMDERLWNSIN